jgi:hypothetical protein
MALLPDDPEQLRELGAALAEMAGRMAGERGASPAAGLSPEQTAQLERIADQLARALAGKAPRAAGRAGHERDGGGHAALRLTEQTTGDAPGELPLPAGDVDAASMRDWIPVATTRAEPDAAASPGAGNGAASGAAPAAGAGGATWQLRLLPRHRGVVQRYFADKDDE